MTGTAPSATKTQLPSVQELTVRDIGQLRFGLWSRLTTADAQQTIARYPGRSVWLPETSEYAIVSPWRNRPGIANVLELSAVRNPAYLLAEATERCRAYGANLVISIEIDEIREPAFYRRAGFSFLEEVITYEFDTRVMPLSYAGRLDYRLLDATKREDLDLLLNIDHTTFPWLWWNDEAEFRAYAEIPGVEMIVGFYGSEPVAYLGMTSYLGWGHLDRIAVLPNWQGQGFGHEALQFAVGRLRGAGALKIGLSTQANNVASRRLYERFGFRRMASNDYKLYGRLLRLPEGISDITASPNETDAG